MRRILREILHLRYLNIDMAFMTRLCTLTLTEPKGFMDFPPEIRIAVYGSIFTSVRPRRCERLGYITPVSEHWWSCNRDSVPPGYPNSHSSRSKSPGPITCFLVPTAILRVNKQIPTVKVAGSNKSFVVPEKNDIDLSLKLQNDNMAKSVKKMVLAIPNRSVNRFSRYHHQAVSSLEYYCIQIREQRPKLRSYRIYLDRWAAWGRLDPLRAPFS